MKQLFAIAIVILLLLSIFPLIPAKGSESANWSKPRPTSNIRDFQDRLGSATSDAQAALGLGVEVQTYVGGTTGIDDHLMFTLDLSASTREGIHYDWNYDNKDVFYSWVSTTQPIAISGDDSYVLINLGFPVLFYGINYSSMYIFSNGFVSFTSPSYASTSPVPLPSDSLNDTIIAPFWRKLKLSQGGSIEQGYVSNWAGEFQRSSNYKVFTWDSIPDINGNRQTFQLLIEVRQATMADYAHQNKIFFQYLSVTNDVTTTIGVQDRTGHHGNTYPLSQITNQSAGGFNAIQYGFGYRVTELDFSVTKVGSDSNAGMDLSCFYEGGFDVELNSSEGNQGYGPMFTTAVSGSARSLLGALPKFGEAFNGFFILWDIGADVAAAHYEPASGTLQSAHLQDTAATGLANTYSSGDCDGNYQGTFDASFSDLVTWWFQDKWSSGVLPHTVTVTATAYYLNVAPGPIQGGRLTTSVTLNMYTGPPYYHYVEVHSGICLTGQDSVEFPGLNLWIDNQPYTTPLPELILREGWHNITVPTSINLGGTTCFFSSWAGPDGGGTRVNQYIGDFTTDRNVTATYLIQGDINQDGAVDIYDAIMLANAYNSNSQSHNWNPNADLNKDGQVDIYDAIILASNFAKTAYSVAGAVGGAGPQGKPLSFREMALSGTNILIDPGQVTVFTNDVFHMNVNIINVTDLAGWEFKLYWNNTVLNCTNAAVQSPTQWQNNTQDYGTGVENSYNSTNGRFYKAETAAYPTPTFNGSMTIATLTFKAMQPGTTSLTLTETKLGNSTGQPIDHTDSSGSVSVSDTRYMRGDTGTVNNLNAYLLNASETSTLQSDYRQATGRYDAYWGIRAWMRCANGTEVEIQLSNHTGTPQAVIDDNYYVQAELSATTVVTAKTWAANASLVVRVYFSWDNSSWTNIATFTTKQLTITQLNSTIWTVYYDVYHYYNYRVNKSYGYIYWGTPGDPTRIENVQFS